LLIGFYVLVSFISDFGYSYVRQTKLASFLVNFWAHEKIVTVRAWWVVFD